VTWPSPPQVHEPDTAPGLVPEDRHTPDPVLGVEAEVPELGTLFLFGHFLEQKHSFVVSIPLLK